MNRNSPERCNTCGAPALVRMQGDTLCARCGLERSSSPPATSRRRGRALLVGLFSSGFLAKMLVGAVAMAAVGGVAAGVAGDRSDSPIEAPPVTPTFAHTVAPDTGTDLVAEVTETRADEQLVERATAFAEEFKNWGDCVSTAARDHSGEAFDPAEACGDMPAASDHGLDDGRPPGLVKIEDKSDDRLSASDERTADKIARTDERTADKVAKDSDKKNQSEDDE